MHNWYNVFLLSLKSGHNAFIEMFTCHICHGAMRYHASRTDRLQNRLCLCGYLRCLVCGAV